MLRVRHVVLKACGIAVARACKLCQEEGRVLAGTRAWGGHVVLVAAAVKHGDCRDDKLQDRQKRAMSWGTRATVRVRAKALGLGHQGRGRCGVEGTEKWGPKSR